MSQSAINSIDGPLREFCEACLALLAGGTAHGSILADVLPSFQLALQPCGLAAGRLVAELDHWKHESQQLIRLATLHTGGDSEGLVRSLEHVSQVATQAINALISLGNVSDNAAVVLAIDDIPESSEEISSEKTAHSVLSTFCESVLVLLELGPDKTSVLPQTMPSLHHVFGCCTPLVLARLRAELNVSKSSAEQLLELADAHYGTAAAQLQQRIRHSHDCAAQIIESLESLVHAAPADRQARPASSGKVEHKSGDTSANSVTLDANNMSPSQALEFYQLGLQSQQRHDYKTAETLYSEALRLDPTLRLAWLQRGRIRVMHRQAVQAVVDLTRALQLFDADPVALRWRGDALAMSGRLADALNDYQSALDILPEDTSIRYNRAVVLRITGRLDRAWSEFERLLKQRINPPGTHLNRGLICLGRGDVEQAVEEFQLALKARPGLPEAIERLNELGVKTQAGTDTAPAKDAPAPQSTEPKSSTSTGSQPSPGKSHRSQPSQGSRKRTRHITADTTAEPTEGMSDELAMSLLLDLSSAEIPVQTAPLDPPTSNAKQSLATQTDISNTTVVDVVIAQGASVAVVTDLNATTSDATSNPELPSAIAPDLGRMGDSTATVADQKSSQTETMQLSGTTLEIRCPACDERTIIKWSLLKPGKVIACKRCARFFRVRSDSKLVLVVKNRRGEWEPYRDRFAIFRDRRVIAGVISVCVLGMASTMLSRPTNYDAVIAEDPGYPKELEPRAQLFTLAWLKGDYRTMRQLTNSVQSKELFLWTMDNPAPAILSPATLERDAQFKVRVLDENTTNARVHVSIDGLQVANGRGIFELSQEWKLDGERWKFLPVAVSNL